MSAVAVAKSAARTVYSVASEIYDNLFDESFAWEMVHAASVRAGIPKWLSWMILCSATASVAYYLMIVRKLARVYVKAKSRASQITERMGSILTTPYSPTPWAFNRHLTTVLGSEIRSKPEMQIHRYADFFSSVFRRARQCELRYSHTSFRLLSL